MNPKARKLLLRQILQAGETLAVADYKGICSFTCFRLADAGVSDGVVDAYWNGLFADPAVTHDNLYYSVARNCFEALGHKLSLHELSDAQLMMLAWLHEMVRSREFDSFLP